MIFRYLRLMQSKVPKNRSCYERRKFVSLKSPIVIDVPTRALLAVETKGFVQEVGIFEQQKECL